MGTESEVSSVTPPRPANVFDYMQEPGDDNSHYEHSIVSSSSSVSSHYQPSDAGSSDAPGTPSSRSSIPSPTTTRSGSVAELRRKYDLQYAASISSRGSSPRSSIRSLRKQPSVSDVLEEEDEDGAGDEHSVLSHPIAPSELSFEGRPRHDSFRQHDIGQDEQLDRYTGEPVGQHAQYSDPVYQPQPGYADPHYSARRTDSMSSEQAAAYNHQMALEHYHYPTPPLAPSPPAAAATSACPYPAQYSHLPPAPDAPDLRKRTIAGYEQLALELASSPAKADPAAVKPLYRKFDYLHHRILLHLQDELAELEEQLRTLDEIIAQRGQNNSPVSSSVIPPASRRAETYSGSPIHAQRTTLLGKIFLKSEQYHAALRHRNDAFRHAEPASEADLQAYKQFLEKENPITEQETHFLHHKSDLVHPFSLNPHPHLVSAANTNKPLPNSGILIALLLVLPLLLFTLIPDFVGRMVAMALLGACAALVASTRGLSEGWKKSEALVWVGVYGGVMLGLAGSVR
jgi:hypothetical protein